MLDLINKFHSRNDGMSRDIEILEWNQYITNWSIVLNALRKLWELGKVSQLKTPFYEPFEKRAHK